MVVVKLQGGLGNQMFQYAAARGLAGNGHAVYLDHHFLEENNTDKQHFTARKYALSVFPNLKARRAHRWQLKLSRILRQYENELVSFPDREKRKIWYLDGYFQSEKYFKTLRSELLCEFRFPQLDDINERTRQLIAGTANALSIHVRRGDYLRSKVVEDTHGVLTKAYYEKSLNIIRKKYPDVILFIFSDEPGWARENLDMPDFKTYYIDQNQGSDSWKDMALMCCCKHHIVANSSFSWWGAWLSEKDGEVFAPAKWFNPAKVNFDINNFVPEKWTVIHDG